MLLGAIYLNCALWSGLLRVRQFCRLDLVDWVCNELTRRAGESIARLSGQFVDPRDVPNEEGANLFKSKCSNSQHPYRYFLQYRYSAMSTV